MSAPQWFAIETRMWSHDPYSASIKIACGKKEDIPASLRMISASGEMLEALEAARDLWGDYLPPGNSNAMKAMKLVDAAIAKAKGVKS